MRLNLENAAHSHSTSDSGVYATDCLESLDLAAGSAVFRVTWGNSSGSLVGAGWTLSISEGLGRSGTFTLRFPTSP